MKKFTLKKAGIVFSLFLFVLLPVLGFAFPHRGYQQGEIFHYKMDGSNDGHIYSAISRHQVLKTGKVWTEKITWISLIYDGKKIDLSSMKDFEFFLSLDPDFNFAIPDITKIKPAIRNQILGPIFDLMTFYVDLNPALFQDKLEEIKTGKAIRLPYNQPSSWADGHYHVLAEDCLDFIVTYRDLNKLLSMLRVEHVPPKSDLRINLPEPWMRKPVVKGKNNNWVQVSRMPDKNKFAVSYGYEYFDVHLCIDKKDGKIVYANLYNPVERLCGTCREITRENGKITGLKSCSEFKPLHTFRNISIKLLQ
ncbi:MAG: hypothetical protein ACQETH_15275 [Candidatus Rifleibacteriota bacterium]